MMQVLCFGIYIWYFCDNKHWSSQQVVNKIIIDLDFSGTPVFTHIRARDVQRMMQE